jgi:hypothetical protein
MKRYDVFRKLIYVFLQVNNLYTIYIVASS